MPTWLAGRAGSLARARGLLEPRTGLTLRVARSVTLRVLNVAPLPAESKQVATGAHHLAVGYRPEIDGLRALAVVPVVLFHAGFASFSGGFVGVDVFFVISGYLISLILLKELDAGRFSITRFYERRARRILPALMVVILCCLPFAWKWMMADELKRFGQSVMSVATFSSNIFFWWKTDYFSPSAEEQPLLHTWSLAVEEQYYVIFPLFLAAGWRLGKKRLGYVVGALALASLAWSEWGWRHFATANFFLLPSRVWELLAGVLTAFWQLRKPHPNRIETRARARARAAGVASWVGAALIVYAILRFDHTTPCPSVYALLPVLGAVLIIAFATPTSGAGRVLASPPVVALGMISYSAYLWHQPILAFARLHGGFDGSLQRGLLALATLPLSYASWRFVEQPLRKPGALSRGLVFAASGAALVTCCVVGGVIHLEHGFPQRSLFADNADVREYLAVKSQIQTWAHWCEENRIESPFRRPICKVGSQVQEPDMILWGDSFAGALMLGLGAELERAGRSALVFEADGCPPIPGVSIVGRSEVCSGDIHADFLKYLATLDHVKYVLWYGNIATAMFYDKIRVNGAVPSVVAVTASVDSAIAKIRALHKEVVFVEQGPFMPADATDFYLRSALRHDHAELSVPRRDYADFVAPVRQLRGDVEKAGLFVDTEDLFCDRDACPARRKDFGLVYCDNVHLSLAASKLLARSILGRIETGLGDAR